MQRCDWCGSNPLYITYHDEEWGVPQHDDQALFEMLVLESMQSGLSWLTILQKRAHFREAFAYFDPKHVASYDAAKVGELLQNPGIIRNRAKIEATVANAQAALAVQQQYGSLDRFLWQTVGDKPMVPAGKQEQQSLARKEAAKDLAARLRQHGFKWIGPTVAYAFMQAVGMVNDHQPGCFRRAQLRGRKT